MGSSIPPDDPGQGIASAGPPDGESDSPAPEEPPAPEDLPAPDDRPAAEEASATAPVPPRPRRRRRRKVLIWTASVTACVVALAAAGVFLVYRHLNGNIQQRDVSGLLGTQPVDLHPQAENILII